MTNSSTIRIAILDDHQIVIDGLKLLLSSHKQFEIVAESTNGFEILEILEGIPVDILLTDVMMPQIDGFEVAMRVKEAFPTIKVVALTMNGEGMLVDKMLEQAEIAGYLLKTIDRNELVQALESIQKGTRYFSNEVMDELELYQKIKKENESIHLTSREIEIIKCIANNMSNKQIADSLFISERTVETHRKNIFRKTDIHTAIGLIEFAKKRQII
ncbi:MAG: response regulator transcription factor [Bacteroidetes bacterium]|nr:response regulator transcription factor [Bacteroidota bacterium]MBP6316467.1 response regulator transcription factor [Chitinophagaceae bacterium]